MRNSAIQRLDYIIDVLKPYLEAVGVEKKTFVKTIQEDTEAIVGKIDFGDYKDSRITFSQITENCQKALLFVGRMNAELFRWLVVAMNQSNQVKITISNLVNYTGMGRKSVLYGIKALEANNFLKVIKIQDEQGCPNCYFINPFLVTKCKATRARSLEFEYCETDSENYKKDSEEPLENFKKLVEEYDKRQQAFKILEAREKGTHKQLQAIIKSKPSNIKSKPNKKEAGSTKAASPSTNQDNDNKNKDDLQVKEDYEQITVEDFLKEIEGAGE